MFAIPPRDVRRDLALGDLRGKLADRGLIVVELELRGASGDRCYAATFFPPS